MKDIDKMTRWLGVLSLAGGGAAVPLMIAFAAAGWGAPGSAAYRTYELLNRLMAGSLLLMTAGWLGLAIRTSDGIGRWGAGLALVGAIGMAGGNAAEFWLLSDLSYTCCNIRHAAWSTFLLGLLVTAVGATLTGAAAWRVQGWPGRSSRLLVLALPLAVIGFSMSPFLGPTILAVGLGLLLVYQPRALGLSNQ